MTLGLSDDCCRVPGCGRATVGYIRVGSKGRREVYVGRPGALNHIAVCAEHLHLRAAVSPLAPAQLYARR
jgi:hypothetical protein